MDIDAPHEAVAELERQMRLSTDIIRFLTVRVDEHDPGPSPMMRRSDRDDRGDRRGGRRDRDFPPREARSASEAPQEARSKNETQGESTSEDKDKKDEDEGGSE